MNGVHDMGGMDGFGRVEVERDEPVFHHRWEGRVFGMNLLLTTNIDAGRHAIERLPPVTYLRSSYYERWLRALEATLVERGVLAEDELDARIEGRTPVTAAALVAPAPATLDARRDVDAEPAFAVGQSVRTRNHQPHGHTRLPAYARGRRGIVASVHPGFILPDTHAQSLGENPQHAYSVRFDGRELWGAVAEPGTCVYLDCFESYLAADA